MKDYLQPSFDLNDNSFVSTLDEAPIWSAPFGLKLLRFVDYKHNLNVLDIGFGTGFPLIELALRLGNSSKLYGIDPWESAMVRAKEKINKYGITNIELHKGYAEEMPYPNKTFDLIISNNGINNVNDLKKVLSECYRVAKTNSQLLFTVNMKKTMKEFYDVFRSVLESLGLETVVEKMKQHITDKRLPMVDLTEHMQAAGFNISQVIKDDFKYRFVDGTTMLNHYFIRLAFLPEWIKMLDEADIEQVFEKVEKELNNIAEQNGKLELTVPFVLIEARKD